MWIMECLRLRVQDVDVKRREILIRDGKGFKDWVAMLPMSLVTRKVQSVRRISVAS